MSESLLSLMMAPLFEYSKIARDELDGFTVSTIFAGDKDRFETAIKDKDGFHPVETYAGMEEALTGHKKWLEFVRSGGREIVELGYGDVVESARVVLTEGP